MRKAPYIVTPRGALVMLALVLSAMAGLGCGSSSEVIVTVGSHKITKAELDHWGPIESRLAYNTKPVRPLPRGVVPEPPEFSACISLLKTNPLEKSKSAAADKQQCRLKYASARKNVLGILIITDWLVDEAQREHIGASDQQVKQESESYIKRSFRSNGEYQDYLTNAGLTQADDLLLIKKNMLATRLERQVTQGKGSPKAEEAALEAFYKRFEARGKAKTICKPGYVVPDCKGSSA
jgi:hypothetical protein